MINLPLLRTQTSGPITILSLVLLTMISTSYVVTEFELVFDRDRVISGEVWRLLTGNLIHTGSIHVLLNVSGIFVLWLLHGDYYRTLSYLGAALFTGVGTTLGLLLFAPDVFWYMGLSGLLHGIFVWGVARDFQAGKPTAWILAAGLVLKLVWEHFYGGDSSIEQLITAPIATEAHLYGSISGALLTGILLMYQGYLPDQLE